MVDMNAAFKVGGVECIAVCDVDSDHLAKSADDIEKKQGSRPKAFKDYRDLLETPGLQAVIIATPPHWHALPFLAALEKGLDIYCEKPLAYDIREGQMMVEAAKNSDRIVQIGFQRRHSQAIREARDYIQSGNMGRIVQVDAQIHYDATMRDASPQEPPASLDWEWWCGPAPKLPYSPNIGHFAWRLEKAYGNGHLVDWGIHWIDAIRWILNEEMPTSVTAVGGIYAKKQITTPDILTVNFEFKSCPVVWRHRLWGAKEVHGDTQNGMFFYGERATLYLDDSRWVVYANEKGATPVVHEVRSDAGTEQVADFLQAVKNRQQPICTPEDAFNSTATVQLGMIAYETLNRVDWDAELRRIPNNAAADQLLKREYRAPWLHPFQS
ncbi:MAG: gfo/Idh/MocA family oxidoreductase [Calditrichaeota bacterium]|nr:MAG: gfo/Idh/MocA family oxidoreductase [Calditrichota bacterium]